MKRRRDLLIRALTLRSLFLLASAVAIATAAALGPEGDQGELAFRLLLFGLAFYVVSRIFDRRS